MSNIEKQCVICGQSCAGQPRIKDASGNYAHKACADKHQANQNTKSAQPEIEPLDLSPEEEPEMAAFLDDLPSNTGGEPSAMRAACPGCGTSVSSGSTICMSCGCNIKTGRGNKTKATRIKAKKDGPSIGAKAGSLALTPFLPIIGAVLGGAIGAGIWATVSHLTGYEIGYIAIGVGFICGVGAIIGSGGDGNAWSGTVAVVVALFSVITGKAIVNQMYVDNLQEIMTSVESADNTYRTIEDFTEEDAIFNIANEIAWDMEDAGQDIDWPDPEIDLYETLAISDFPQSIIDQTHKRWESMDQDEQLAFRQSQIDEINESTELFKDMLAEEMDSSTNLIDNLTPFDALWAFLALGAVWSVGSGGSED